LTRRIFLGQDIIEVTLSEYLLIEKLQEYMDEAGCLVLSSAIWTSAMPTFCGRLSLLWQSSIQAEVQGRKIASEEWLQ
jgi:hypothetical protein